MKHVRTNLVFKTVLRVLSCKAAHRVRSHQYLLLSILSISIGIALSVTSQSTWSATLAAGQVYQGGTQLDVPEVGISLKIPNGWQGGMTGGGEVFAIDPVGATGFARVFIKAETATRAQVTASLQQPVPLDNLLLTPVGAPDRRGALSTVNYQVTGTSEPVRAMGAVRLMPNGTAVSFVVIAGSDHFAAARSGAFSTADSLKVLKKGSKTANTPSTGANSWQQALSGRTLRKYHTGGGYSERTTLRLCADGNFVHAMGGSSHSTAGTGAFAGRRTGRWQAHGATDSTGKIVFKNADGQVTVPVEYANDKLYIDGTRWLRDSSGPC